MAKKDWKDSDYVTSGALNALGAEVEAAEESAQIAALQQSKEDEIQRGVCATATSTVAKVISLDNVLYVPKPGDLFIIEFTNGQNVASATMSINGSPALPMTGASGSGSSSGNTINAGVEVLILHDTTTYRVLTGNTTIYGALTIAEIQAAAPVGSVRVVTPAVLADGFMNRAAAVPSSPIIAGRPGQYALDATYLYLCVATNSWRRIPLQTF